MISTFFFFSHSEAKKDIQEGIFDVVPELFSSGYSRMKMSDKLDKYFVDTSMVPLMMQENYLKALPTNNLKTLSGLLSNDPLEASFLAADSFSQSDYLVDSLIHGY